MDGKTSDWRPGPSVCRCCLAEGCYKDISTEYFWMGKREVYADMLSDTFSVSIAYSSAGGPNSHSRLICEPCISRLRDAADFKRQVQECERTFMQHLDPGSTSAANDIDIEAQPAGKEVKLEQVKLEKRFSDDDFDTADFGDEDDDDMDDQPLTKFATKVPKKEAVDFLDLIDNSQITVKRMSMSKSKAPPAKKVKVTKKEPAKPTASKAPIKVVKEKKKKETKPHIKAKRNAEVVLKYSTVYPFRVRAKTLICVYCCDEHEDPSKFRQHVDEQHASFNVSTAFAHVRTGKEYLKVDCIDLRCRICSESADTIEDMARHIKSFHKSAHILQLNLAYDIALQPYRLEKDKWYCYLCSMKLPSLHKLCRHTTSHFLEYTCDACGRRYLTMEALKYHIKCSHTGQYMCRKCWTNFPTSDKKREHTKMSKPCWPFACIYCGERFLSWEQKRKHLVDTHDCPETTYTCPECMKIFTARKLFYNHYKLTHTDDSFICTCCGLKFESKKRLEDHRLGHTGEKHFKCPVCAKSFMRNKSLTQHMWIHSETKRFVCLLCEKQFAQKVSLKCHMRSHHPEVNLEI
ncbi:oocyte zinc finger protein XlCOF6 isoform X15 [Manduca sexta]|uniref:oocyte zinc finger protein XlCOF6 isoform X15 n=1 Tax=Manduca sexta TaxID=7130 RepID=UPI00188F2890|nr:oocyte zinc finger protein XlCOF6 isoform X15 [Manduca sexta]